MKYGDWKLWTGEGEPPTGMVQVVMHYTRPSDAEALKPVDAKYVNWGWCEERQRFHVFAYRQVIEPVREVVNCSAYYSKMAVWNEHFGYGYEMAISITLVDGEPDKTVAPVARWVE